MPEPKIPGGYILLSRKILESDIWSKPPLYIKVWVYLLSLAQHKQYKGLKRGQLRTSIPDIQEACSWYVGYRKEQPTYEQVYGVIQWLRKRCEHSCEHEANQSMITTTKATHGIIVDIVNYDIYQDPKSYETNAEPEHEKVAKTERSPTRPDNTNKNDKNDKKNKYSREAYDLLHFWNEQNIVVHQETDNTLKQIEKGLKKHPFDEIKKAIERYVTIYRDPDYFYKHKWTLPKFLSQSNGVPDFLDEGIRWVNYQQQAPQREAPRRRRQLYLPEESE